MQRRPCFIRKDKRGILTLWTLPSVLPPIFGVLDAAHKSMLVRRVDRLDDFITHVGDIIHDQLSAVSSDDAV